jgi:peptidoglycan/xylan/chitin deacetylase (PgdA/CDA1 family)
MEVALRDWLLGCNPWGTSMIVGYPSFADYPDYPHSSYFVVNGDLTYGGLVDGPVYYTVFKERADKYMDISENPYNPFNNGIAVYHDDLQDFSTNEPTMDGTAGLTYYFGKMESKGSALKKTQRVKDSQGATVRVNPDEKKVYFIFSADTRFNGGPHILKTLKKAGVKGSFFLTGNCLRMEEHKELIENIIADGHYVGGHSDNHLLYAPWEARDSSLVTRDSLIRDLQLNMAELEKFGIGHDKARWFLPPYEYYNSDHVKWLENSGIKVMNLTPGTATAADYTTADMPNYRSSQTLINTLLEFEKNVGLNGAIILIHPGVESGRPDPLYHRLPEIIKTLKKRGYTFGTFSDLK